MENHEITEVTEAMIFGNNAVNTEIFRVFLWLYTNIYTIFNLHWIKSLIYFAISAQKSFGTNSLLHISRALLLTYSAIGMHVLVEWP